MQSPLSCRIIRALVLCALLVPAHGAAGLDDAGRPDVPAQAAPAPRPVVTPAASCARIPETDDERSSGEGGGTRTCLVMAAWARQTYEQPPEGSLVDADR